LLEFPGPQQQWLLMKAAVVDGGGGNGIFAATVNNMKTGWRCQKWSSSSTLRFCSGG
jgi:hypothetical protein